MEEEAPLLCYLTEPQISPYHPPEFHWGRLNQVTGHTACVASEWDGAIRAISHASGWLVDSARRQQVSAAYDALWETNGAYGYYLASEGRYDEVFAHASKTRRSQSRPFSPLGIRVPLLRDCPQKPYPLWSVAEPHLLEISHHKRTGVWIKSDKGLRKIAMDTFYCCSSEVHWRGANQMYQKALDARAQWLALLATCAPVSEHLPQQHTLWADLPHD